MRNKVKMIFIGLVLSVITGSICVASVPESGFLKIGGFYCIDIRPVANDKTFDLYKWGAWRFASFRQDIWKRCGVPYWHPKENVNIRIAGEKSRQQAPSEIVIDLGGITAEEIFCIGNVGTGFDCSPDVQTPVGEYVICYENGNKQVIPLIAGKNVAHLRYGNFVPEAKNAYCFEDNAVDSNQPGGLYYHLDEMLPVSPKIQLMMFSQNLRYSQIPLKCLKFRCTNPQASLYLAAVTLRQSGPRISALYYNGRMVKPYPQDTPIAKSSPIEAMLDKNRRLSLDGKWQYLTDPGNQGVRRGYYAENYDASSWDKMSVPSQWYVQGVDYHGVVWFRNEFVVPASFPGSIIELNFERVDYDARVWVNGQFVGRHIGAYSSFKFDVTKTIKKGKKNLVVVRVDSPLDPGFQPQKTLIKGNAMDDIVMPYNGEGSMGGIYRSVTLVGRGDVGIENVWTVSEVSRDLAHADVIVKFELNPSSTGKDAVQVKCRLTEQRGRTFEEIKDVSLDGRTPVEISISIDNPKLWWVWEQGIPHLYVMEMELWRGNKLLDTNISRIGVRQVSANNEEHCIYLNHHRIFIKGMLNDDIHWQSLMDRTGYRQRIQLQKDANLNLIRMIGHQSSPDMYDLCDEMGMLIWQEMPLQWGYSQSESVREDIMEVVRDVMIQCRPHASVIGWSAWNEGGQKGFTEKLVSMMYNLDSTRPMWGASGGSGLGDEGWNVHIYPNLSSNLSRQSPMWIGIKAGFVSEVGAYGLSSLEEMKEILGDDLFSFNSAEYYWDTFSTYRWSDSGVFLFPPHLSSDATKEQMNEYILTKITPSERWLMQFMKFMYENFRGQLFTPFTAAIHCRFDDAFPTAFLGVVNFNGTPRKAYYSVQQACQQVLPIIFFDYTGVEDIRVVNEYWYKNWKGCTLKYLLKTRDGKVILSTDKKFDLPSDSVVTVFTRQEAGDVWHLPGFFAELTVLDVDGSTLSRNSYDLTKEEIDTFVANVYPLPPIEPVDSIVLKASDAVEVRGVAERIEAKGKQSVSGKYNMLASMSPGKWYDLVGTYSELLLKLGGTGDAPYLKYTIKIPEDGQYFVRAACDSGKILQTFELFVDGQKAELQIFPQLDITQGITRLSYSEHNLSWYPGWEIQLSKGEHILEFKWPDSRETPVLILDAICLQRIRI